MELISGQTILEIQLMVCKFDGLIFQGVNLFEMVSKSDNGDLIIKQDHQQKFAAQMEAYQKSKDRYCDKDIFTAENMISGN